MFHTVAELVTQAAAYPNVAELMVAQEMANTGRTREQIRDLMGRNLDVMVAAVHQGIQGVTSVTGLTGGDAKRWMRIWPLAIRYVILPCSKPCATPWRSTRSTPKWA